MSSKNSTHLACAQRIYQHDNRLKKLEFQNFDTNNEIITDFHYKYRIQSCTTNYTFNNYKFI